MIGKIKIAVLLLGLPVYALARDEYTRTFDKTVALQSGQKFRLEHSLGDIEIHTHPGRDVVIHADIKASASNANEAKSFADKIAVLVENSPGMLAVRTKYPERPNSFFGSNKLSYTVHYAVTVPETAHVEVQNSFGAVEAAGLKAGSDIRTSHGSLTFRNGRGTQRLQDSFANVEVTNNEGDVMLEDSNGAVTVSDVSGLLSLRNRFGAVNVSRVGRGATITNSNGAVHLTDVSGTSSVNNSFGEVRAAGLQGNLSVNNSNGKVEANNVKGSATLNTSFSSVHFSNVGGAVSVTATNSSVEGHNAGGPLNLDSSFGAVDVGEIRGGADIKASNGAVTVANISGQTNVHNSFGLVRAESTGPLTVHNSNAGVKASDVHGDAVVNTSFGAVLLDGVTGAITVGNQNGAVEVTSTTKGACHPITIHTSFSAIRLHLPTDASYRLSATTSFGKLSSELPLKVSGNLLNVSGGLSSDSISGTIGRGQCELRLTNNNGDISILSH